MKKIIVFIIVLLAIPLKISGLSYSGCEYSTITRMRKLIGNINISYDYYIENNKAYFSVTINNMTPEIYFVDTKDFKTYTYSDTNNGEIVIEEYTGLKGGYKFYSADDNCYGTYLETKRYSFPPYNPYFNSELCKGYENYSLCDKWVEVNYNEYQFLEKLNEYKEKNKEEEKEPEFQEEYKMNLLDILSRFYIDYYYILFIVIITFSIAGIYIDKKKNRFKL